MSTLKEQKEAFVTGHQGTKVLEILLICLSSPIGLWAWASMAKYRRHQTEAPWRHSAVLWETVCVLMPMGLCQTKFLYPWGVGFLGLEAGVASILWLWTNLRYEDAAANTNENEVTSLQHRRSSVTCYRSTLLFLTFVAILAVDFHIFPRRFAKTETQGYGWMDLGAGSFVVAAGLSSRRARGATTGTHGGDLNRLMAMGKRMLPLLLLGGIRLATNKGLEYQEHVSEYGVHWNFFLTLAVVTPVSMLLPNTESRWSIIVAVGLLGIYQWALSTYGLQAYVEDGPRRCSAKGTGVLCNLFAANREGILGCVGYLALFLASEFVGRFCLWQTRRCGTMLWTAAIVLWAIHWILTDMLHIRASRRSTNSSFCVWTLAHNVTMLAVIHTCSSCTTPPPVLRAINQHGLLVFVVANLLTGLVNLSMNTLAASDALALSVLSVYVAVIGGGSLLLEFTSTITNGDMKAKQR